MTEMRRLKEPDEGLAIREKAGEAKKLGPCLLSKRVRPIQGQASVGRGGGRKINSEFSLVVAAESRVWRNALPSFVFGVPLVVFSVF